MNITNIDDKIIKRARQNHLYELYLAENEQNVNQVFKDINSAVQVFEAKYTLEVDVDKQKMMSDMVIFIDYFFQLCFNQCWKRLN